MNVFVRLLSSVGVCLLLLLPRTGFAVTLNIGVIHDNVNERYNFLQLQKEFETLYPDIRLQLTGIHSNQYKRSVIKWLEQGEGPDVLYWYASERLLELARKGYVADLTDMWAANGYEKLFQASLVEQTSIGSTRYAIPVSYYPWSFFYNQDIFQKFKLSEPHNWQEFLHVCKTLKQNGITPLAIGYDSPWVLAAWFDFLNLRINGKDFHQRLLSGRESFQSAEVVKLFEHWQELVQKEYFLSNGQHLDWMSPMPYMYREMAAMSLIGYFLAPRIPDVAKAKTKMFAFPQIDPQVPQTEVAPADVFFIRASSSKQAQARQFLAFISASQIQNNYNQYAGGFSPRLDANAASDYFAKQGEVLLRESDATTPYFDRLAPENFATQALQVFKQFMLEPDIQKAVTALEDLRIQSFANAS